MAIAFNKDGDTVQAVFTMQDFQQEQQHTVSGGQQLLVQVQGIWPVFISDSPEQGISGVPVFPGVAAVVENSSPVYVSSPQGSNVVFLSPGSLAV